MKAEDGFWWNQREVDRVIEFYEKALLHVKGPWSGRPFELETWQVDEIIAPLFGWRRGHSIAHSRGAECDPLKCEYGRRRYRALNLVMPRKNGKSMICSGLLIIGLCADGELGGENYCMAGDLDQADDLVFEMVARNAERSAVLKSILQVFRSSSTIVHPDSGSTLKAIPANFEGALGFSPHVSVMDEYLVQANTQLENAITSGSGARRQPVFVRATTAPKTMDSPAGRLITRLREIRDGLRSEPVDELNVLHEAPAKADWRKVKVWKSANPGYGTSLQPAFVDTQIRKAIDEPMERAEILQYGLNIVPDGLESWMPLELWDACAAKVTRADFLEALSGDGCIVAVGMRSAMDLVAIVAVFPPLKRTDPTAVLTEFYLPEGVLRKRADVENAPPYQDWIDRGLVHVHDADVIDFDELERVVVSELGRRFQVREVVCNPRGAMQFIQRLQREEENVIEMVPTFKYMSPALSELERLVGIGPKGLLHDGNDVMRWMWRKAKITEGPSKELRPDQQRSLGNIQGVVALASALNRAIVSDEEDKNESGWAAS